MRIINRYCLALTLAAVFHLAAAAQGTGFNFQGRLNDGTNPTNGQYDLQFRLYDALAGGNPIGSPISRPNTVLINGVFSTTLDFGSTVFAGPNSVFIEIAVKPGGSPNTYTILGPRQQLTIVPYAVRSANSTNADFATNASKAANSTALDGLGSGDFIRNSTIVQPGSNFNISGNGGIGGNLTTSGDLILDGDLRQSSNSGGAVKAMARIRVTRTSLPPAASAAVLTCFSSVAPPGTPNCGITFGSTIGPDNLLINFGFSVSNRFISLTAFNDTASVLAFPNGSTVQVDDTSTNGGSSEFFIYVF